MYLLAPVGVTFLTDVTPGDGIQGSNNGGKRHTDPANDVRVTIVTVSGRLRVLTNKTYSFKTS